MLIDIIAPQKNDTILVYDVHASETGALSILNDFYKQVRDFPDKSVRWIFVVSMPEYEETDTISVLRYPWVKSSLFHRAYFDLFYARRLIKQYRPKQVFSLQNMGLFFFRGMQTVYLHLAQVFCEHSLRFRWDEKKVWFQQKILSKAIFYSLRKVNRVVVQTKWMKNALIKKRGITSDKVIVETPDISTDGLFRFEEKKENLHRFFYPATAFRYKNHITILRALEYAVQKGMWDYEVLFTIEADENKCAAELYKYVKDNNLKVKFIGLISRENVFEMYAKSVLLFPSVMESFGIPLLEARLTGCPVIASDCPFSHEVLDGYEKAEFFSAMDWREMGEKLLQLTDEKQ